MDYNRGQRRFILLAIAFGVALHAALANLNVVGRALSRFMDMVTPLLAGAALAFILNVPMRFFERHFPLPKAKKARARAEKLRRPLCFAATMVLVLGVALLIGLIVLPEFGDAFSTIASGLPGVFERLRGFLVQAAEEYPAFAEQITQWAESANWQRIPEQLVAWLRSDFGMVLGSTVSFASNVVNGITSGAMTLVFMMLLLMAKDKLASQLGRTTRALARPAIAERIFSVSALANQVFSRFISTQFLEAAILGLLILVGMLVLRMPFAPTVSVLVAFLALIPLLGAFIGCVLGTILILMVSPIKALWFVVLFLVIQQIEGNLIYPRVVGTSLGLPPVWVLAAVILGGNAMGIVGMLLFIPVSAVLYALCRQYIAAREEKRRA